MQCRNCGIEIADRAIVCYRCGTPTTDPVRRPVTIKPKRGPWIPLAVLALLVIAALYLGQASRTAADPEPYQLAAGVLLGAAVVVLVIRLHRRR
jgi:hypothetical protein